MSDGITIKRTFAASRQQVFEAWTKPERFSVWFGSEKVPVPLDTLKLDVREGGSWSAIMILPDGTSKSWAGEYLDVDSPNKLVLTMTDDASNPKRETLTVLVTEVEQGREMTFSQSGGNLTEDEYQGAKTGYGTFFDSMEKLFA